MNTVNELLEVYFCIRNIKISKILVMFTRHTVPK